MHKQLQVQVRSALTEVSTGGWHHFLLLSGKEAIFLLPLVDETQSQRDLLGTGGLGAMLSSV